MGEAKLYFEDVQRGRRGPGASAHARAHRPGPLRRGVRRLQPDAPRRGQGAGRRATERVRPRDVLDGVCSARHSPTLWASGTSPTTRCGSRARPGPGSSSRHEWSWPKTRVDGDRYSSTWSAAFRTRTARRRSSGVATAELPSVNAPKPTKKAAKKAAPAKKAAAAKKVTSAKKAPASKKAAAKKAAPAKKAATAKKAVTAKKTAAAKKAVGSKKASASKKATPAKKAQASKKVPASKKKAPAKKAPAKKVPAKKVPAKKVPAKKAAASKR